MNNRKKASIILLVVLVIYTGAMIIFAYPWEKFPDNFTEAKDGVVMISTEKGSGSGFAIGKSGEPVEYIVTNCHVVFNDSNKAQNISVIFSAAANRYMSAQIYAYDIEKDLAVLKLPEPTTERSALKLCRAKDADISKVHYALGYPYTSDMGLDYVKYDTSDITTTSGIISRSSTVKEVDTYLIDIDITHGNSGGPLVNENGEVVGINTFSLSDGQEQANYAVCIDELLKLIDYDDVGYTLAGDINVKGIIIIILILGIDISLIITMLCLLAKRRPSTVKNTVKSSNSDMTVSEGGYGKTVAVSDSKSIIAGIEGVYKGKEIPVKNNMLFGRDSKKCDVVFPIDTEGVSGHHCLISYNKGKVMIRDMNSTYGTFINNGLRIDSEIDVEICPGDVFYLGSEKEKFIVKIKI